MSGRLCPGTNREGRPCGNVAGFGTTHVGWGACKHHAGSTPSGIAAAAREQAAAEAARLGTEVPIDAIAALEWAVNLVAGEARWLQEQVRGVDEAHTLNREQRITLSRALSGAAERLAKVAKLAADSGVAERRLELDELALGRIVEAIRAALAEVDLTDEENAKLRAALERHFALLEAEPRRLAA